MRMVCYGLTTIVAMLGACGAPVEESGPRYQTTGASAVPAPAAPITAQTQHAAPPSAAATAGAPAVPPPAAPIAAAPVVTPVASAPTAPLAAPIAPKTSGFNAGSGTALPDGVIVEYHIPNGTGGTDWNPKDKPIRVRRGMTLRLIDDDKSTRSGGHWLHTNGQPCAHGLKAIGTGFDCKVGQSAPIGSVSGVFEHNVANGIGRLYIDVVAE